MSPLHSGKVAQELGGCGNSSSGNSSAHYPVTAGVGLSQGQSCSGQGSSKKGIFLQQTDHILAAESSGKQIRTCNNIVLKINHLGKSSYNKTTHLGIIAWHDTKTPSVSTSPSHVLQSLQRGQSAHTTNLFLKSTHLRIILKTNLTTHPSSVI